MITAKTIIEALTPEQLDKEFTNYLIETIKVVTGGWKFKIINKNLVENGKKVGAWLQISRIPPGSVPKLYEFIDFKCRYDFSEPCYLYYAYGRDKGEFKSKTFKVTEKNIKQKLVSVFKKLYFDGKTPNLDKVIDTRLIKS
jgi:hypothetical protein